MTTRTHAEPSVSDYVVSLVPPGEPRLIWLMVLRVTLISALLGATLIMNYGYEGALEDSSPRFLLGIIASSYVLTILYAIWHRSGWQRVILSRIQLGLDLAIWGSLVYVTGGVASGFTFLFDLWVIVAAVVLGGRIAFWTAGGSTLILAALAAVMYLQILSPLPDQLIAHYTIREVVYFFGINVSALFVVAALVSSLVSRLELTGHGLALERVRRANLAEELEKSRRLAALGELGASLAHEIRNPLSAVSGSVQMLLAGNDFKDEDNELGRIISREIDRIERLVGDMLHFVRPRPVAKKKMDLGRLACDIVGAFRQSPEASERPISCTQNESVWVMIDPDQMRQVIWNLLRNAAQATEAGDKIEVRVAQDETHACLEVEDSGLGIEPEKLEEIFDPFYSTRERGIGLGLALCDRIVKDHGGRIRAMPASTKGTLFRIVLDKDET